MPSALKHLVFLPTLVSKGAESAFFHHGFSFTLWKLCAKESHTVCDLKKTQTIYRSIQPSLIVHFHSISELSHVAFIQTCALGYFCPAPFN